MKITSVAISACLILANCAMSTVQPLAPIDQAAPTLTGEPFDQVLLRVKQEIGLFQSQSASWHANLPREFQRLGITPRCGTGDINFNIKTVKMEFATTFDQKDTANVGLKIPFGPPGTGSVGPGLGGTYEDNGVNTLDFTYYVPATPGSLDMAAIERITPHAVIAPTLSALRDGLVRATAQLPCMTDTPADKDDTFTFSVVLTHDVNPTIGFNFLIVSANAGADFSNKRGNTITVTFHPTATAGAMMR